MLKTFRRHLAGCKHKHKGRQFMRCACPLWVDGTLDGRRVLKSLDTANLEIAATRVLELEADKEPESEAISADHAVNSFLKTYDSAETKRLYGQVLHPLQKFCIGKGISLIRAITLPDLYSFKETWDCSALTAGKRIERLRTFFRYCEDNEWVDKNPATRMKKPPVKDPPVVPFTDKEWKSILKAADKYPTKNSFGYDNRARVRAFILTLRYSGLRIGDTTKLKKSRLDRAGMLTLYTSKAGVPVRHPLPKFVVKALKNIGNGSEYFFWSGNGMLKSAVADWQRTIARLMKLANVEGHPHQFRHTLATNLLTQGVSMEHVAAILGNSPEVCRRHYAPWEATRQKALEQALRKVWAKK